MKHVTQFRARADHDADDDDYHLFSGCDRQDVRLFIILPPSSSRQMRAVAVVHPPPIQTRGLL